MTQNFTRETRDGREVLIYEDGTIKDATTGHFLHPPRHGLITTSERGRELRQRAVVRKQEVVNQSAADAVARNDLRTRFGGESWIAALTETQMEIATTADAGKAATFAADWLIENSGHGELKKPEDGGGGVTNILLIDGDVAQAIRRALHPQAPDVIEAEDVQAWNLIEDSRKAKNANS